MTKCKHKKNIKNYLLTSNYWTVACIKRTFKESVDRNSQPVSICAYYNMLFCFMMNQCLTLLIVHSYCKTDPETFVISAPLELLNAIYKVMTYVFERNRPLNGSFIVISPYKARILTFKKWPLKNLTRHLLHTVSAVYACNPRMCHPVGLTHGKIYYLLFYLQTHPCYPVGSF